MPGAFVYAVIGRLRAAVIFAIRWVLAVPSPSMLAKGPPYGPIERRYIRLRDAGRIGPAYPMADIHEELGHFHEDFERGINGNPPRKRRGDP